MGLLQVIKRVVLALRAVNPGLVYVCDPVLGDDGKLYLPAQMVDLYRYTFHLLRMWKFPTLASSLELRAIEGFGSWRLHLLVLSQGGNGGWFGDVQSQLELFPPLASSETAQCAMTPSWDEKHMNPPGFLTIEQAAKGSARTQPSWKSQS